MRFRISVSNWPAILLACLPLSILGCDDSPAAVDDGREPIVAASGDPCPGWVVNEIPTTCRTIEGDTLALVQATLSDSTCIRFDDDNCADVVQRANAMLSGGKVYLAHHDSVVKYLGGSGGGYWLRENQLGESAILIGEINFLDMGGSDPYKAQRADALLHEAAHDLSYLDCDDPELEPGSPCAGSIGYFCSLRGGTDPWADVQEAPEPGGGGDPCEEMFFCEGGCWVAWFEWIAGEWTQVSEAWWDEDCLY